MIIAKDFYLLRTPLLPINFLKQFEGLPHAALSDKLRSIFADPSLQEAIYIASPELFGEFQKWMAGQLTDEKEVNKLTLALYRYLLRMATRCTPYGLFAGCAVGSFDRKTGITLGEPEEHHKHRRLDMNYVAELAAMITSIPEIQSQLRFYPNNSLYKIAGRFRYAEYTVKNKFRNYHVAEIACTPYLETMLHTASEGAGLEEIARSIVNEDICLDDAREFAAELVTNQILVSELEPTITGEEFFSTFTKKISTLAGTEHITNTLQRIHHTLKDPRAGTRKYLETHALVKKLLPDTNSKDLVQTDLFLHTRQNSLSEAVVADLQKQMEKLTALATKKQQTDLDHFIQAFRERYEDQEIPLVWALDAESGIGYAGFNGSAADHTPLVDDISTGSNGEAGTIAWNKLNEFQLKRLHACLRSNAREIELTDADLDGLRTTNTPSLPDSLYLVGSLLGASAEAIDAGNYQLEFNGLAGPSIGTLLGRFCHGNELLHEKTKQSLKEEEQYNPDYIYAEVIHLPEARAGNILLRPQLRNFEIVYLGNGSVPESHQLPLTDLMVSVKGSEVILRSKKWNKRVIPRLSTAHNFITDSLPAYKFLGDLQFQQLHSSIAWNWHTLKEEPFLPRVRYGRIILSKCTWTLHKKDFPQLDPKKNGTANYTELFEKIRQDLRLPQYVVIVEGDNDLLINMNNESSLHILANSLSKKEKLVLQEFLNGDDQCFVEGKQGRYTNEVIIPFKKALTINPPVNAHTPNRALPILQRKFITGSEWLYLKIYCGSNNAERLLKELIKPLVQKLHEGGIIDKWFFIRYADPHHHIRIRFHHATRNGFWKDVLDELHAMIEDDTMKALAYKVQLDTYEREIERYGSSTMEISEDIFYFDSESVMHMVDLLEGEEGEQFRWLLAVRGVDMLLEDFDYSLESRAALLKKLQQAFYKEFGANKTLNDQLNAKYREHMHQIRSFLDESKDAENGIEEAVALFTMRSHKTQRAVSEMKQLQEANADTPGFHQLLPSYIHMFLNRVFISNQRKHELVIYHFLSKFYDSQIAIKKAKSTAVNEVSISS